MLKKFWRAPEFIFAVFISIVWSAIFYFVWKPLIILALIWLAWYGAIRLRENLSHSRSYVRPVITGLIWGIVLGFGLYFLNAWARSPLWWTAGTYILGFFTAGHIGYGHLTGIEALTDPKRKTYHLVSLSTALIVYVASLLLLYFAFNW